MKKAIINNAKTGAGGVVFACYPVVNGCSTEAIWYGTAEECSAKGKAYEKAYPEVWCIVLES